MIKLILKGIAIGVANIIPGVSGGTLAVVLGIYDKLTDAIGNFLTASNKQKIEYIKFLFQIGVGAVIGILLFAKIVQFSVINYPKITAGVFTALIVPSIPFITKGEDKKNTKNIIFFLIGGIFAGLFVYADIKYGTKTFDATTSQVITLGYLIKLFVCGGIAAGAMIIPGISGSMLLLMLGEYYNILGFINKIFDSLVPLSIFALGVGVGLIVIAKIINYLLEKYRSNTLFFITGIIVVSIVQIWLKV